MTTEMTETLDLQTILVTIEQAEVTISVGREKARRAKALLGRVEAIEKQVEEAQGRVEGLERELKKIRARADREITTAREALGRARKLQPILGKEFVAQAQAAVARLEQEWATRIREMESRLEEARQEVRDLEARLDTTRKELRVLAESPEVQAYLAFDEARRQEEARRRALREAELRRRLRTLRPGILIGEGEEALRRLAKEAGEDGFDNLAAEAAEAAERAARVRLAREAEAEDRARRRFLRWCRRHARRRPVLVLSFKEHQAVALQPAVTRRGRIVFTVAAATGFAGGEAPKGYSQLPARARFWKGADWDPEGLPEPALALLRQAVAQGMRGAEFNEMNAALARAREQEQEVESPGDEATQADVVEEATSAASANDRTAEEDDKLAGLPTRVAARLRRAGLTTREAIEEAVKDEASFLALPGVGPATLAAVREWLGEPVAGTAAPVEAGEAGEPSSPAEVGLTGPRSKDEEKTVEPAVENGKEDESTLPDVNGVEPEIVVVGLQMGADMPGTRLAAWRGISRVLTGTLKQLGISCLEILVEETWNGNGNGPEIGLLATWDGHAVEVTIPGDGGEKGRRILAMRRLRHELRAAAA